MNVFINSIISLIRDNMIDTPINLQYHSSKTNYNLHLRSGGPHRQHNLHRNIVHRNNEITDCY